MSDILFAIWNDKYSIGSQTLDSQHQGLFDIINELYEATQHDFHQKHVQDLVNKLKLYIQNHFADEEQVMEKINYPLINERKKAHSAFKRQVMEFEHQISSEGLSPQEMLRFVKDWLIKHIMNMDKKIEPFLAEYRQSEEST